MIIMMNEYNIIIIIIIIIITISLHLSCTTFWNANFSPLFFSQGNKKREQYIEV